MLEPIFAWSWGGHGTITAVAVAAAIAKFIQLGKSDLMKRFFRLSRHRLNMLLTLPHSHLYKDVDQDQVPATDQTKVALETLFHELPRAVQNTDIHLGNIPWLGVGEFLDGNGQVRHFMRSTEATSETEAFQASMGWIKNHLTEAFEKLHSALFTDYGWAHPKRNARDFNEGLVALGEALHTVEDSYSPGHTLRDPNLHNLIAGIYYLDDNNTDPHGDWPGHEALDDPHNRRSKPYFASAKVTTTELVYCVLSHLDGDADTFGVVLAKRLDARFHLKLGARVLPADYDPAVDMDPRMR